MNFKSIVISIVILQVIEVNCGCEDYVQCIGDFLQSFFVKNNDEVVLKVNTTNNNVTQVRDTKLSELDRVLNDLSGLLNAQIKEKIDIKSDATLIKRVDGNTNIYVKTFNLDKSLEKVPLDNMEYTNINEKVTVNAELLRTLPYKMNQDENANHKTIEKASYNDVFEKSLKNIKENEILSDDGVNIMYYDDIDDNATDYPIIDYIDMYKDTTNEEYIYIPTTVLPTTNMNSLSEEIDKQIKDIENLVEYSADSVGDIQNSTVSSLNLPEYDMSTDFDKILPWIVTIFVKNESMDYQFQYVCDGALLSEKVILTAARCVHFSKSTVKPEDLLVVLGKKSLHEMAETEITNRISEIIIHENFTQKYGAASDDLAILIMDEAVEFQTYIQPANISTEEGFIDNVDQSATTAWAFSGKLEPVYFEKVENGSCSKRNRIDNAICATYGLTVALCPSYGGLYVSKQSNDWFLQGIMSGDPSKRGICIKKRVMYTSLQNYLEWIGNFIGNDK